MQSQLCRICGERHHRYEPHRFRDPKVKFMYDSEPSWPAEDAPPPLAVPPPPPTAAPEVPRGDAQPPTRHTRDTDSSKTRSHDTQEPAAATPAVSAPIQPPDTPDTAPLPEPRLLKRLPTLAEIREPRSLNIASLDDTALDSLRNLVMAEWMKRHRRRKRAARRSILPD